MTQNQQYTDLLRIANNIEPTYNIVANESTPLRSLLLNAESVQLMAINKCELFPCRNNTENRVEIDSLLKNLRHSIKTQVDTETLIQPQNNYIKMNIQHKVPNLKSKPNDFWYKGVKYSLTASEYKLAECIYEFMFQNGETPWN